MTRRSDAIARASALDRIEKRLESAHMEISKAYDEAAGQGAPTTPLDAELMDIIGNVITRNADALRRLANL